MYAGNPFFLGKFGTKHEQSVQEPLLIQVGHHGPQPVRVFLVQRSGLMEQVIVMVRESTW